MKSNLQKALEWIASDYDLEVRSYSGRAMNGRECLAFTGNNVNTLKVGFAIAEWADEEGASADEILFDMNKLRIDDFGMGQVFYFPGVSFSM